MNFEDMKSILETDANEIGLPLSVDKLKDS